MGLLKDIVFKGGVVKDETVLAAKPQWTDSDRIRFVRGLPQKLGGWAKRLETAFDGKCRGLLPWLDNSDVARLGIGTHTKLYVLEGDGFVDITPFAATGTLTDPFETTDGSAVVTVTDSAHGRGTGDTVIFDGASAVGGITIDGTYAVTAVLDSNTYTVTHSAAATGSATGGGSVDYEYEISIGRADGTQGAGWGVGGYGEGTYGTARSTSILLPPRTWHLDQWGPYLVACPRGGNLYQWTLSSGSRAALVSNAPTINIGMFVTEERHVVMLGAGGNNMLVQWCDQGDLTAWTPSDLNTAGSRQLTGGTRVLCGIRTRGTNLIFTDGGVWTMTFLGGLDVFGFQQVAGGAAGIVSPHAAVEVAGVVFWMGLNGFNLFDGTVRRIPNSRDISNFVFGNLDLSQRDKVYCGLNTQHSEIWWFYATAGEIDRYVKYNYEDRTWDVGSVARTAMVDRGVFALPIMAGPDSYLYDHETGMNADGAAMNEYIVSSPIDIADGDSLVDILSIIPDFKSLSGSITLTLLTRYEPNASEEEVTVGSVDSSTRRIDTRASGRQVQLEIGSAATGTNWRLGQLRFDLQPAGRR